MRAMISAPKPQVLGASWTMTPLPVFLIERDDGLRIHGRDGSEIDDLDLNLISL